MANEPNYKWIGMHPQDLTGGRMLGMGDPAYLSTEDMDDPHNKALIDEGLLIPLTADKEKGGDKK